MGLPAMPPARKEPDTSTYSGRVGKRIRDLRESKGMTLKQVVEHVNQYGFDIKVAGYSLWELGQRQVDLDALPAIADCFGVAIKKLLPDE